VEIGSADQLAAVVAANVRRRPGARTDVPSAAGVRGGRGERHPTETHLIPIALQVVAGRREHLTIYGKDYPTEDGTCIRDYIHVEDLSDAHLLALTAPAPGEHRIFNLGNGTGFSVQQVIDAVREVTGHPVPVEVGERRAGDPAQLVASSDRIRTDLGWTPKHTDLAGIVGDAWETAQKRA
jgi:UDP-glucose 4-epimerase